MKSLIYVTLVCICFASSPLAAQSAPAVVLKPDQVKAVFQFFKNSGPAKREQLPIALTGQQVELLEFRTGTHILSTNHSESYLYFIVNEKENGLVRYIVTFTVSPKIEIPRDAKERDELDWNSFIAEREITQYAVTQVTYDKDGSRFYKNLDIRKRPPE